MKVFLIILAVIVVLFAIILSITAEFTIIFDKGWTTRVKILFIEKDVELSKLLSFIVAPEKVAADVAEEHKEEKEKKEQEKSKSKDNKSVAKTADKKATTTDTDSKEDDKDTSSKDEKKSENKDEKPKKKNFVANILEEDGVLGLMLFLSNVLQTLNSAVNTLIKGLHIYSLYVKMIIGGGDASDIAQKYGSICGIYYPIKGYVLNGFKVDQYDDLVQPDFIAPASEYEFQFIGSISVGLLLKVLLKAGKVFVINLIKNK